tara:strand:+ start:828 stop:2501 length:1674 start_codon:yes stop_codon:yes gene_type:complete
MKLLIENWRGFVSEEVNGKQATGYHATWVTPDKFQKIFRSGAFKSGEGKEKGPGYGAGLYVLIDPNPESKTMMGHYGPHIYKFDFSLDDFVIFDPEISEQVYGKNTSIADQLRAMGKEYLIEEMIEEMEKYDWGKEHEETMAVRTREALEAPLELVLEPDGTPRVFNLKAQNYAKLLQPHVNGMVFTAGTEKGTIAVLFKPEVAKLTGYVEHPGDAYIDKKKASLGPGVGEKWLDDTTKQMRQRQPDWEPNEYMLNKAKSYSEFPNFRPLEEAVDPKMKKYLKKHPYMEPDGLQEDDEVNEAPDFQTRMKKQLPAELDFLLNKGSNNKKEGPGIKNPKKPKFDSKPPGAAFGEAAGNCQVITVLRLGSEEGLANRNAANTEGLQEYLERTGDYSKPQFGSGEASERNVYIYKVEVCGGFGDYKAVSGGARDTEEEAETPVGLKKFYGGDFQWFYFPQESEGKSWRIIEKVGAIENFATDPVWEMYGSGKIKINGKSIMDLVKHKPKKNAYTKDERPYDIEEHDELPSVWNNPWEWDAGVIALKHYLQKMYNTEVTGV